MAKKVIKKVLTCITTLGMVTATLTALPASASSLDTPQPNISLETPVRSGELLSKELIELGNGTYAVETLYQNINDTPTTYATYPGSYGTTTYTKYLDIYATGAYNGTASLTADFEYAYDSAQGIDDINCTSSSYYLSESNYRGPNINETSGGVFTNWVKVELSFYHDRGFAGITNYKISIKCDSKGNIS